MDFNFGPLLGGFNRFFTLYLVFPSIVLLGLYLTFRLKFVQVLKLKLSFTTLFQKGNSQEEGNISHYQAVAAVLASNFGTGNISGMAVAIATGGPGALVWMWVMAFFGSAIQYASCILGVSFRSPLKNNEYAGGPMYYLRDGLVTAPARWVAGRWSDRAPAYLYRFDHVDERARARTDRAGHGSELFYVFQTLGRQPADAVQPTPGDEALAAEMHARWIAFARTGSPNPPGVERWPAYSRATDAWMVFGPNGSAVHSHVLKPQLDWQEGRITPLIWLMQILAFFKHLFRLG